MNSSHNRHTSRDHQGRFASIADYLNGSEGFFKWISDVKPRIPSSRGGYEIFNPADFQRRELSKALAVNKDGSWKYSTIVLCWPRRHSKTICNCLLVIYRFFNYQTQNIKVLANSERQVTSTAFKLCRQIILNTPALYRKVGKNNVQRYAIYNDKKQSEIQAIAFNESAAYGEKVSVGWITELTHASDDSVLQVLASSVGDSLDGWILIDSTTDGHGGPLEKYESLAESGEDPTVFVSRIEYQNLEEALDKSPPWIRKDWLVSRSKQMLPAQFASQHLNQRGAAVNSLFKVEDIEASKESYRTPLLLSNLSKMVSGKKVVCGGGLDRAYGFSTHGDRTVYASTAKVAGESEDHHYYVLNVKSIPFSSGRSIRKTIAQDFKRYCLQNICIETFNCQDIHSWAVESKISAELINPTTTLQTQIFSEIHRIVSEKRLHFPENLKRLAAEMKTFIYESSGKQVKFGHAKGFNDDFVYSLAYSIWATRDNELAEYEIQNIICRSKSKHANLCYLRNGDLILHCSVQCESHKRVEQLYSQYMRRKVDGELTLPIFFHNRVKRVGYRISQAA